jgi:hypothetical protein
MLRTKLNMLSNIRVGSYGFGEFARIIAPVISKLMSESGNSTFQPNDIN